MKKVLAVSGGVDSMVLLEMFRDDPDVVVAHFNHGTRPSADDDQAFVEAAAKQ
jgi:tRNA(Ile)-lysidine synthase TilS/MesJ